jgi:16S rRNA (cytosine1402-N4)-methyltransferase
MDPGRPRSARDVVNEWEERDLADLFRANGEGRFARRIAKAIISSRPITTTAELADTVKDAIPAAARRTGGHPARRVFQAIRIAVNEELEILPGALDAALDRLSPGGRCVVLAYHSGEDRIVKDRFRQAATGGCICPPGLPCGCGAVPTVRLLNRGARRPADSEIAVNRRAESARLRAVEALSAPSAA